MKNIVIVAIGGAIGSVFRYGVSILTLKWSNYPYPIATFLVNVIGCFVFGLSAVYIEKLPWSSSLYSLLILTGFCGGFTTFSAFAAENIKLMLEGRLAMSMVYILASIVLSFLAFYLGLLLGKNLGYS